MALILHDSNTGMTRAVEALPPCFEARTGVTVREAGPGDLRAGAPLSILTYTWLRMTEAEKCEAFNREQKRVESGQEFGF